MKKVRVTIERLRELLSYDPDTGLFTWLISRGGVARGSVAGCLNVYGHVQIYVERSNYYGHHLAWFYMTGEWPIEIDHENRVRNDNRWDNLRKCTRLQNAANSVGHSRQGLPKGVQRSGRKYCAKIYRGRIIHLGTFPTAELASEAYKRAAQAMDGEFFFELRERIDDGYQQQQ